MKFKINIFNANEVKKYIKDEVDRANIAYLNELDRMAMKVVTAIRDGKPVSYWDDHTGNLRSSIGYVILHDGKKLSENFKVVNGRGEEGMAKAKSFAQQLTLQYPSGIVILIVAGMDYAEYVERVKSRTVLEGGKLLAKKLIKEIEQKWSARYGK
jgi:hypothetical protein